MQGRRQSIDDDSEDQGPELDALLHALCDERLDEAGYDRLKALLAASDDACRRYIEFMHLCVGVSYPSGAGRKIHRQRDSLFDGPANVAENGTSPTSLPLHYLEQEPLPGEPAPGGPSAVPATGSYPARFSLRPWAVYAAVAAFAILSAVWTVGYHRGPGGEDLVERSGALATGARQENASPAESFASSYVARIVKASPDCQWGELTVPIELLVRVRAGDRLHIVTGLMELEFHSGARVILHGPAIFTPTGLAAGHLESGRLTGEVSNGDFRLVTPAAEVIDLGTAFGVAADAVVGTDVVVFDGRVQVVSQADGGAAGEPLDMVEGMAARFRMDGTTEYGLKTEAAQFMRRIPVSEGRQNRGELCLIDVIAGGDGTGNGLAGAIDPATGRRDYGKEGRQLPIWQRRTTTAFHPVAWHPLIDGMIVPTADGRGVQINSLGGKVDLPPCEGFTWASVWARRAESVLEANSGVDIDFWGERTLEGVVERLKTVRNGLVGLHANAGVTFDLRMMQMVHRRGPQEFRGEVANIENSTDWTPHEKPEFKRTVNFHILIDGETRYERLAFRREDGNAEFAVPLSSGDRFLTVIATDDGNIEFDHVVLIDPVIVLHQQ